MIKGRDVTFLKWVIRSKNYDKIVGFTNKNKFQNYVCTNFFFCASWIKILLIDLRNNTYYVRKIIIINFLITSWHFNLTTLSTFHHLVVLGMFYFRGFSSIIKKLNFQNISKKYTKTFITSTDLQLNCHCNHLSNACF